MIEREIEITSGWGEYELAIKGVRAFVCEECGAISLRARGSENDGRYLKRFCRKTRR